MTKEMAVSNAMAILAYVELKQIGTIRSYTNYLNYVTLDIHFDKGNDEIYDRRNEIFPLLADGTTIAICRYPQKDYETLDITWDIK